jgi:tRNA threonylcarbamoyladenosine biosynthesis protein TsaE
MEPYAVGGHAASHFDFYRLRDAREFDDAGLRDIFAAPGLKLAEWPDRAAPHLPVPDWRVEIEPADVASNGNARHVTVHAFTPHGVELLASSS